MRRKYNKRISVGSPEWWAARTRVDSETGCVLWTGFVCRYGYARTRWKGKDGVLVHRIAYEQAYGEFDQSLNVCHRCDTPRCCNPKHLFLGTQKDNLRDMFAKGRARPRGKATPALAAFPSLSYRAPTRAARALSNAQTRKSAQVHDILHLTRTGEPIDSPPVEAPLWCQVTDAPESSPRQAIVPYTSPPSRTAQPAPERLSDDATLAGCWPGVSARRTTGTRRDAETRAAVSLPGDER